RKGAWLPLDLFCKYVVRELKKRKNPTSNLLTGMYWEQTQAQQIMTFLASRQGMYRTTKAAVGSQRTTKADSKPHAILVCDSIGEKRGFRYNKQGRCTYKKNTPILQ